MSCGESESCSVLIHAIFSILVIPLPIRVFINPFESTTTIKPNENTCTQNKENSILNIVRVFRIQQHLASEH